MNTQTFRKIDITVKWLTLAFAWACLGVAIYQRSILIFIVGPLPYLLIYNGFVRGTLQRKVVETTATPARSEQSK